MKKKKYEKKPLSFKDFNKRYKRLSDVNRFIVFQLLISMKKKNKNEIVRLTAFDLISKERYKKQLSKADLYKALNKKLDNTVTQNTYESFLRRGSLHSELFDATCELLGISKDDYTNIDLQAKVQGSSVEWLYNSLCDENQFAVTELVQLLLVAETDRDYFEKEILQ